jgi:hypothetical protein
LKPGKNTLVALVLTLPYGMVQQVSCPTTLQTAGQLGPTFQWLPDGSFDRASSPNGATIHFCEWSNVLVA